MASGAGAAALACLTCWSKLGMPRREHLGHRHRRRGLRRAATSRWTRTRRATRSDTEARTLAEVIDGRRRLPRPLGGRRAEARDGREDGGQAADPGAGQPRRRRSCPRRSQAVRPDAIIATGRSDYPNQVNNVLCFPFIFRGALDVGATTINEDDEDRRVRALAELARDEPSEIVAARLSASRSPASAPTT